MTFVNLTPHVIRIRRDASSLEAVALESDLVIPPSGQIARVSVSSVLDENIDNVPIYKTVFGGVVGLPDPTDGTIFIVSSPVGSRVAGRPDVVGPKTDSTAIRDENGQPFAVFGLQRF